jgi:hypothetical protein
LPFGLPLGPFPLIDFCFMLDGIKILNIMFGFLSFFSSFLYDVLDENVCHAKALLKLGDVQVTFWILF